MGHPSFLNLMRLICNRPGFIKPDCDLYFSPVFFFYRIPLPSELPLKASNQSWIPSDHSNIHFTWGNSSALSSWFCVRPRSQVILNLIVLGVTTHMWPLELCFIFYAPGHCTLMHLKTVVSYLLPSLHDALEELTDFPGLAKSSVVFPFPIQS